MATYRRKALRKELLENGGKSVSGAMRKVGYSKAYSKNPQLLTKTKSWQELMEQYIPEKLLAVKHSELLNKKEFVVIGRGKDREAFPTGEIDADAVARGLDMGYKLRGKYKPTEMRVQTFTGWTPQELKDYAEHDIVPERFKGLGFESQS